MADNFKACCVEGCNNNAASDSGGRRGFCSAHYWHWKAQRSDLPKCSVEGCHRTVYARGFCGKHWSRYKTYGDPTMGRTENGEPGKFLLVAMTYEGDECLIWPYARDNYGYARTYDGTRMKAAHIIVCERAHGPRPSKRHQAAHRCGKGHHGCISPNHVRWLTVSRNQRERVAHGTSNRGEKQGGARLTERDIREIRSLAATVSQRALAERFGVDPSHVSNIVRRKAWGWL